MKRIIILIDGGFLRVNSRKAGKTYDPDFIEKFAQNCTGADEEVIRILYYDCAPYSGTCAEKPNAASSCKTSSFWRSLYVYSLRQMVTCKDLFAVRLGVLKFRGYKPNKAPVNPVALTDADFSPDFEQKGVDMRIGLDIASYSANRSVDRIVLVSNDTDCVPAMKYGRRAGLQVVIIQLQNSAIAPEITSHSDYKRLVPYP